MKRITSSTTILLLLLLLTLTTFAIAQPPRFELPNAPNFGRNVSVHDPSIFKDDDGTYYTFGSHFATSSSTNLMSWSQVTNDGGHARLFGASPGWRVVLADAVAHVEAAGNTTESIWAPDVIKLGDKYYMYYSLSTWGSNRSYIGRVEADNVTGPYRNSVEIVKTSANRDPNAIDPALFYDKDGGLWMTYGSFFTGMYVMELENSGPRIGLPKTSGFGTQIWRGGTGPEGPYIFYNAQTDYYYLMVTSGSLFSDYNMRVARSRNPNGPYADIAGRNVATANNNNVGNKLAGNFRFDGAPVGYAALGHNSVLRDNGKYFVIYHTRTDRCPCSEQSNGLVTMGHHQQVNQLFFNSDGWPVMAPNRYAGEIAGRVLATDFNGDYDVVIHTAVGDDVAYVNSVLYTFGVDGIVRQGDAVRGTWSRVDNNDYHFTVTINDVAYNGVAVPQYNFDRGYAELSFTGVSPAGVSLWANRRPDTWVAPEDDGDDDECEGDNCDDVTDCEDDECEDVCEDDNCDDGNNDDCDDGEIVDGECITLSIRHNLSPTNYMMNIASVGNGAFRINYTMRNAGNVRIELFDIRGRRVRTLVNASRNVGDHQESFNVNNLSAGTYIVRLQAGGVKLQERVTVRR